MSLQVQGLAELRSRLEEQIPQAVMDTLQAQIEKEAEKLVQLMRSKVNQDGIKIDWTWGSTPRGAVSIGTVRGRDYARVAVTIYAMGFTTTGRGIGGTTGDFAAIARWAEFGTAERFHKSGKYTGRIQTGAYFYPSYRERKRAIKTNVTRAIKRGIKSA